MGSTRNDNAAASRGRTRLVTTVLGVTVAVAVIAFVAMAFLLSRPSISADAAALAKVDLPLTSGTIERVTATGPNGRTIPVSVRDGRLWPDVRLSPGEPVTIDVVLHRSGWIGWLAGSTDSTSLSLRTPSAAPSERYLTLPPGSPLKLEFDEPVSTLVYREGEQVEHRELSQPVRTITLTKTGEAGSIEVAAASRPWETLPSPSLVTWFPDGAHASAVVSPRPGTRISPNTPIYVTFSQPLSQALGSAVPHLEPAAPGRWHEVDSHTIVFRPRSFGFGLDTGVTLTVPHTVHLIGGQGWSVPAGSTLRAQQILAELGYLPLRFTPARAVARTPSAQESAAIDPPPGSFSWRYGNVPGALQALWQPGSAGVMMRGAVMAFESAHEMTTDGEVGPAVWRALLAAEMAHQATTAGYTFVMVSEGSETLQLWNNGSIRLTTPVNTGIATAPTELGTFTVYEHIASGTMSGTNPDGSHYEDPGVPWISYFNGGDALHGFERAQYGFPQSLGCVEMPPATAGEVWPYTPIGTLVQIS